MPKAKLCSVKVACGPICATRTAWPAVCSSSLHKSAAATNFPKTIDEHALARYFTLNARDWAAIMHCRGDHNRLGFAGQLCWLRWLGWQPASPSRAPREAILFIAQQLHLSADSLSRYPDDPRTWWTHTQQVREHLGWRVLHEPDS